MIKTFLATVMMVAIFFLSGCSEPSKPAASNETTTKATEPATPTGPVTGKTAYWPMYTAAYKWAPDLVLLRLSAKEGVKIQGGKSNVWEATFGSPGKHEYRVFTYAVDAQPPDTRQGVTIGNSKPWGGVTRDVMAIQSSDIAVDSDAAYTAALADADAWIKKNPDKPLSNFQLGNGYSYPAPVWYIMWGEKKAGYASIVNATTGKVLKAK